ncbi:MAG: MarR family transcriptional regulator [Pseudomonadota bacterium]
MRNVGLTGSTRRIITYLSREDGQTQASLAKRLDITRVALGEAVDRLEKSGHVKRRPDAADRRKWRVHLTRKSRDLLPEMFAAADQLQAECFRDFSDAELLGLQATLGRLRERLTDITIESPDDEAAE